MTMYLPNSGMSPRHLWTVPRLTSLGSLAAPRSRIRSQTGSLGARTFMGPVLVGFSPWLWAVQIYEGVARRKKTPRQGGRRVPGSDMKGGGAMFRGPDRQSSQDLRERTVLSGWVPSALISQSSMSQGP